MIKTKNMIKNKYERSTYLTFPSLLYQNISRIIVGGISTIPYLPSVGRYDITLCHAHKFVWFRIAKAASRTILDIFKQANINLDADHPYSCHYPVNLYSEYFKFSFVRNPWDRLISCWLDKVVKHNHFAFPADELLQMQQLENFIDFVARQNLGTCNEHIRLQSKSIDLNNIDYIGRVENFDEHLTQVMQHIGIEPDSITIGHENATKNRFDYKQYYSPDLVQKVATMYRKDITIFSYQY